MRIRVSEEIVKDYGPFFSTTKNANIFQTPNWIKAMENNGLRPIFFVVEENSQPIGGIALYEKSYSHSLLKRIAKRFNSFIVMGKAVINDTGREKEILALILDTVDKEARNRKIISLDWSTNYTLMEERSELFKEKGHRIIPFGTYILCLDPGLESLWANLNKNKRRDIKIAHKNNVFVQDSVSIEDYLRLQGFICKKLGYSQETVFKHIKNIWDFLSPQGLCKIFLARDKNEIKAGAFILIYKDNAYYLYGASLPKDKSCAAHLLLWEVIRYLYGNGIKYFDFGGARASSVMDSAEYPVSGTDMFKKRYGGEFRFRYGSKKIYRPIQHSLISSMQIFKKGMSFLLR